MRNPCTRFKLGKTDKQTDRPAATLSVPPNGRDSSLSHSFDYIILVAYCSLESESLSGHERLTYCHEPASLRDNPCHFCQSNFRSYNLPMGARRSPFLLDAVGFNSLHAGVPWQYKYGLKYVHALGDRRVQLASLRKSTMQEERRCITKTTCISSHPAVNNRCCQFHSKSFRFSFSVA